MAFESVPPAASRSGIRQGEDGAGRRDAAQHVLAQRHEGSGGRGGGLCSAAAAQAVVVGAKGYTEQLLVAEMTVQLLQATGLSTHKGTGFATTGVRTLQERGIIDVYWEYTGTSLTTFNQVTEKLSPDEAYARVEALDAQRGLVWLAPSKVNNTYALAMRRADAAAKGIGSISDLASKVRDGDELRLACTVEFVTRADGLKPLEQTYGFQFGYGNVVGMDPGAVYGVLQRKSEFDVGVVFSTDGRVSAFDLTVLRDDRASFPATYSLLSFAKRPWSAFPR